MTARVIRFPLPAMYALDEHGPWLAAHPREVSEFTWDPGVAALLDMTDPQFPNRRVLLDVDTLHTVRVDRVELDGKFELTYDPDAVRRHVEALVEVAQRLRFRYDTKVTARALRRLAAGGARSSWPQVGERLHPEHPLENEHWIRPTGLTRGPRPSRRPATRPPETCEVRPTRPTRTNPATHPARAGDQGFYERALATWPEFRKILEQAS
jgi:hypothetical protein